MLSSTSKVKEKRKIKLFSLKKIVFFVAEDNDVKMSKQKL